jgi:hypothetical protein
MRSPAPRWASLLRLSHCPIASCMRNAAFRMLTLVLS